MKLENITNPKKAREYILKNFDLKYLELPDDKDLINNVEHFLIAIFNPKYND